MCNGSNYFFNQTDQDLALIELVLGAADLLITVQVHTNTYLHIFKEVLTRQDLLDIFYGASAIAIFFFVCNDFAVFFCLFVLSA